MADATDNVHATAIALGSHAALIRGAPGSGKSDLALRCLALAPTALIPCPVSFVADDRVDLRRAGEHILAAAPAAIRGKLEVRGLGVLSIPSIDHAEVMLIADIAPLERIERLPDPAPTTELLGVTLPLLHIAPFTASAPIKLLLALAQTLR
ncbi:MAG: HPr kinase/phosphatase C-terminal domain-containing protein, partial [Hyphomicrobium sp.]